MKKTKSKNPLIIFFSIMMMNMYQTANPLGFIERSNSKNSKGSSPGKNKQKQAQKHYTQKEKTWVRGSRNANRFFLLPILSLGPSELYCNKVGSIPKPKGWQQLFVNSILFVNLALPELTGSTKATSSENTVQILKIKLALHWSHLKPSDRLVDAGFKVDKWTNSTFCPQPFPANIPTLLVYAGLKTALEDALAAVGNNRPSSDQKVAIDFASKKLQTATMQIMTVWQNKADSDVIHAISIAVDGGFDYMVHAARGPRKSGLWRSTEPGVMVGTLEGAGSRQWEQTEDGGETAKAIDPTSGGVTVLKNLTSGKRYGLRGRKILTKGRYGEWSNWMYEFAP